MSGQSTGGFTSMMISGAEIFLSDLQDDCNDTSSGGLDEINIGSSCEIISLWQDQNPDESVIKMQDRVWATILLALEMTLCWARNSSVDSDILIIASDIDETVSLSEVNKTQELLGEDVIHSAYTYRRWTLSLRSIGMRHKRMCRKSFY